VSSRSVLLVDDDPELLRQLAHALTAAGYRVQTAQDGDVGLRRVHAETFDIVVTDIVMPVREGLETIVALRKARPHLPIIAISGGYRIGPENFLTIANHLGAAAVLAKPFHHADLVGTIARVLAALPAEDAA